MKKRMLVNASGEEVRVAILEDRTLQDLHVEHIRRDQLKGNIYRGVIVRVEPAIQAAFVDYGAPRNGFLAVGDVLPHWYSKPAGPERPERRIKIEDVLRKGQPILVQVIREEDGSKGAALTTRISLPGRYVVLMPFSEGGGISRKIEDEKQRQRLKEIHRKLASEHEEYGVIVRTVGFDQTKAELEQDLLWLQRLWKNIEKAFASETKPGLIFREQDVVLRALRDYFTSDIDEVLIDDEEVHQRVSEYVQTILPRQKKKFTMYRGERPLFALYGLETQVDEVYQRKVPLKSGGAIVIDRTEALVAIDVNSGRSLRERDMETTALNTNLEAAEEVARQLRLRDLGGLIVVDFIDMKEHAHRRTVERNLTQFLKQDKAKHQLGRIDDFGLLVLSRQRIRPPLDHASHEPCRVCQGRGMVRNADALARDALRSIRTLASSGRNHALVRAEVPAEVALCLLNQRREALLELERATGSRIEVIIGMMAQGEPGRFEGLEVDPLRQDLEGLMPTQAPVRLESLPAEEESGPAPEEGSDPDLSALLPIPRATIEAVEVPAAAPTTQRKPTLKAGSRSAPEPSAIPAVPDAAPAPAEPEEQKEAVPVQPVEAETVAVEEEDDLVEDDSSSADEAQADKGGVLEEAGRKRRRRRRSRHKRREGQGEEATDPGTPANGDIKPGAAPALALPVLKSEEIQEVPPAKELQPPTGAPAPRAELTVVAQEPAASAAPAESAASQNERTDPSRGATRERSKAAERLARAGKIASAQSSRSGKGKATPARPQPVATSRPTTKKGTSAASPVAVKPSETVEAAVHVTPPGPLHTSEPRTAVRPEVQIEEKSTGPGRRRSRQPGHAAATKAASTSAASGKGAALEAPSKQEAAKTVSAETTAPVAHPRPAPASTSTRRPVAGRNREQGAPTKRGR